ncbi:MAG: M15 family metallopeptidase [Desulfovibrionaceae bacterium]|nr:M15 family metallopeptidase [Desulfovibrionaceae bacterium]
MESYPDIWGVQEDIQGIWLIFKNGERVLYSQNSNNIYENSLNTSPLSVDVKRSMEQPYVLEPERPETPEGYAPGRKRSYALFSALYGKTKAQVQANLRPVRILGGHWSFVPQAAEAFKEASLAIMTKLAQDRSLKSWLKGNGSFCWRKIAGESVLSVHSFGIAFDIGVGHGATYWRWCKKRPHPLQKTYPSAIVASFEEAGFIWGGKWHEYDLMHFEYRPELICKAKRLRRQSYEPLPMNQGQESKASGRYVWPKRQGFFSD